MHAIPLEILERQDESIGIPLFTVASSTALKNYEEKMSEAVYHCGELARADGTLLDICTSLQHFIYKLSFNLGGTRSEWQYRRNTETVEDALTPKSYYSTTISSIKVHAL